MGVFSLPTGYNQIKHIDLQKDKKLAIAINLAAFIVMAIMVVIGIAILPFQMVAPHNLLVAILFPLLSIAAYFVAHELVHGAFFKKYSGKKAKYGFTGMYAYAGSDAYFNKRQYLIIALSPVVILGTLFLLLNMFLPAQWFWNIYLLQIINISGASGDLYVTNLMRKLPADMLVHDSGVSMTFYSQPTEPPNQ